MSIAMKLSGDQRIAGFSQSNMAASTLVHFVERGKGDPREIDKDLKNKWNWSWCDRETGEGTDKYLFGDCFRKVANYIVALN